MKRGLRLMVSILLSIFLSISINADDNNPGPKSAVKIFDNNIVHFTPDDSSKYNTGKIFALDKGRLIFTKINFRPYDSSMKITAHLQIYPIPKDDIAVYDPWDRAGNIRLVKDNMPDIEIIKFITAYGGYTEYKVDITHLAPLLRDSCTIECFIDTWMTPGWKVDFDIIFEPQSDIITPDWAQGIMYTDSYNKKEHGEEGLEVIVDVPEDIKRIKMHYFVSGHCTDGTDADEFVSKDNVIYVDGIAVYRYRPWRDDCRQFREINPYTRRWSDGSWSSDYSRSGWCPGDFVKPLELDLTDHLTPGRHKVRFVIENVRPENEKSHFGYWRLSSYLLGWKNK